MTEAFAGDYYEADLSDDQGNKPQPSLSVVPEPRPAFVQSSADIEWWNTLPAWRQNLYLLPKTASAAERTQLINNTLGMTVVRYSSEDILTSYPQY